MYPSTPTTYALPFDGKIRIASKARFVLVRWLPGDDTRPFIVRRSESKVNLERDYDRETDYIVDQVSGRVTYHFNDHQETFDSRTGRDLGRV